MVLSTHFALWINYVDPSHTIVLDRFFPIVEHHICRDAQYFKAPVLISIVSLLYMLVFDTTRNTPACPKINENVHATKVLQVDLLTCGIG